MKIELNAEEQALRSEIEALLEKIKLALSDFPINDTVVEWEQQVRDRASKLHNLLKARGFEPKYPRFALRGPGLPGDHARFYAWGRAVDDLLQFLDDDQARDDSPDATLNRKFTVQVYSNRWKESLPIGLVRTFDGWTVIYPAGGGRCDTAGQPHLFNILRYEGIQFPENVGTFIKSIWDEAFSSGLCASGVQRRLQKVAMWISNTERNTPRGSAWPSTDPPGTIVDYRPPRRKGGDRQIRSKRDSGTFEPKRCRYT
jgi:hypothetical protein